MRIYFIRHGHPNYHLDLLSSEGHSQAKLVAQRLCGEPINRIISSPQGRARQTATYLEEKLGIERVVYDWLREIEWGDLLGVAYSSGGPWELARNMVLAAREPLEGTWREDPEFRGSRLVPDIAYRWGELDAFLANEGYKKENFGYTCTKPNNDNIAVFSHGGVSSALFSRILDIPFPIVTLSFSNPLTAVSVIDFDGAVGERLLPRIVAFADVTHLGLGIGKAK